MQWLMPTAKPQCWWNSRIKCLMCRISLFFKVPQISHWNLWNTPCFMTSVFFYFCTRITQGCKMHFKFGILGIDRGGKWMWILLWSTISTVLLKAVKRTIKGCTTQLFTVKKERKMTALTLCEALASWVAVALKLSAARGLSCAAIIVTVFWQSNKQKQTRESQRKTTIAGRTGWISISLMWSFTVTQLSSLTWKFTWTHFGWTFQ